MNGRNPLLLLAGIIALSSCSLFPRPKPSIRIGSTQTEIHQAIATSSAVTGKTDLKNDDLKFQISAGYEKGLCNRIQYTARDHRKLDPEIITMILVFNSRGCAWHRDLREKNVEYCHSFDGKYHARIKDGREIFVVTDDLFQKSMRSPNP